MAKIDVQLKIQDDFTIIEARIPHRHNGRPNLAAVQAVWDKIDEVNPGGFDPAPRKVDGSAGEALAQQQFERAMEPNPLNTADTVGPGEA